MTKEELEEIIKRVEDDGYTVVAIVCDMETCHQKLASNFGVTVTKPSFTHPLDNDREIFWLFDSSHCLKNSRNHLEDQGFRRGMRFIHSELCETPFFKCSTTHTSVKLLFFKYEFTFFKHEFTLFKHEFAFFNCIN